MQFHKSEFSKQEFVIEINNALKQKNAEQNSFVVYWQ